MEKITWKNLIKGPIPIVVSIIITTAGITYAIVNNLIVAQHILREENYKDEILRLEKVIDQKKEIENLDSLIISLRKILTDQANILEKQNLKSQNKHSQNNSIHRFDTLINKTIMTGEGLLTIDPTDNESFKLYYGWRRECIELLKQIDLVLLTDYRASFTTLTKLEISDYQQFKTKVSDGLSIIKILKNY
jgi:hypothetical protein